MTFISKQKMNKVVKVVDVLRHIAPGKEIIVNGWVRTRRDVKEEFSFMEINDGSCRGNLQIVANNNIPGYKDVVQRLTPGTSITVEGKVVESPAKGQRIELIAASITVHGFPGSNYPLQKKRHSFEFLRTIAHLRPRTNTFGAVARIRHSLSIAVHDFFNSRGFFYGN